MTMTTSTTVSSALAAEVLARAVLQPLRSRYAAVSFCNGANIDGLGSLTRSIPKANSIAAASQGTEGVDFNAYAERQMASPVDATPVPWVQGVELSTTALRTYLPGMTREEVIRAVKGGDPATVPLLVEIFTELLHAHLRPVEQEVLALFSSFTLTDGTPGQGLSFLDLVTAQMQLFDQDPEPEHRSAVCLISQKGITDLRTEILAGSGSSSVIFSSGYAQDFLTGVGAAAQGPTTNPTERLPPAAGDYMGMPIVQCSSALMATANGGADQVGAIMLVGRGETGSPGSARGAIEVTLGHDFAVDLAFDHEADAVQAIARWAHIANIHTNQHGLSLVYDRT